MEKIEIRKMRRDDLTLGLRLSRQAGWNQTEADWLRLMDFASEGRFVAELDGRAVGTTTTCILGTVAWIAMVLVDVDARGRGIGTRLLTHAIDHLEGRGVKTIRLDATPAGRVVYEKLGLVAEYELARYEGTPSCKTSSRNVVGATPHDYRDIAEFDRKKTGTDRRKMLVRLFEEFSQDLRVAHSGDRIAGYVTTRPGANAFQVGPCVAETDVGSALLSAAFGRCEGDKVFVDVPKDNLGAVAFVESAGLRVQRGFTRMCRGRRIEDDVTALWAGSGAEKG
jgi:ribosomal protein S18 acetylase RimI-like enzyme